MPSSIEAPSARTRRPALFARAPEVELDCRGAGTGASEALRGVMQEADRLHPGQILAIRTAFEPALLCRVLAGRGFQHWPEPAADGDWTIYFLRGRGGR
ncbi:MAG TPA: DUF2249 domain-containing protein [Elusimicrobiota bacterium]|nr:DUF2249 domain-containing protein [Elusimicrobiota bacterium]